MKKTIAILIGLLLTTACLDRSKDSGGDGGPSTPPKSSPPTSGSSTGPVLGANDDETDSHQVGNGGGGICVGGECTTLTESGLRIISPAEEYYMLTPAMVQAVRSLLEQLPIRDYRQMILKLTVGNGKTFKVLDVVDSKKLEVIRQRYAKVLAKYNPSIDMADVQIFAFAGPCHSYEYCTYLLPEFFKLSLAQQAKILLHEANVRGDVKPQMFLGVLEFDGMIEDLVQNPGLLMAGHFRIDRWLELLGRFGQMQYSASSPRFLAIAVSTWFAWIHKNHELLFESAKISHSDSSVPHAREFVFDLPLLNSNYSVDPAFARLLNEVRGVKEPFSFQNYEFEKSDIPAETVAKICLDQIKNENYISVFYPYQSQPLEYELLRIACLRKDGKIIPEVTVLVPW